MSNITESLKRGLTINSEQSTLRSDPDKMARVISHLFKRFATLYAKQWIEAQNDRDGWARELADFSLPAIAHGVTQAEKRYPEWPPNLAIFKSLCQEYTPPLSDRVRDQPLYRDSPKDTANARKHKGYIRALLDLPDGDEKGLQEYLTSDEHRRNVHRMRRPYGGTQR